jgi:hypothetical protein
MKEAPNSPYAKLVFRETFNSEQSVRNNGGVPTDVTFEKGIASFNGSATTKITYPNLSPGTYSIRVRLKNLVIDTKYLIDFRRDGSEGVGFIYITGTGLIFKNSGKSYVDGVANNSAVTTTKEIVVTGLAINSTSSSFVIGNRGMGNYGLGADIDLVEIYQGTLTASEVKNLYDNDWNKEFISSNLLLDYDSTNGYITDRAGKNTLTPTNVTIKKTGIYYGSEFNGVDSTLITDSTDPTIWQSGFTLMAWVYNYDLGNLGRIFDKSTSTMGGNGFNFYYANSTGVNARKLFFHLASVIGAGTGEVMNYHKWYFVVATVSSDSKINFYIGDLDNAPALSGTANQTSGLISGITTTNPLTIGNRSTAPDRGFGGKIKMAKAVTGELSLEDLTQIWSSTRGKVN